MKLTINTLIVDDRRLYAEEIKEAIDNRNCISDIATYISKMVFGRNAFEEAIVHITNAIEQELRIDLFFCDYHLGGGERDTGIDLFKLFNNSGDKPFRILHSNTTKRFEERKKEYQLLFDDFAKSKRSTDIEKTLRDFEDNIVKLKLYGNPNLHEKYYTKTNQFILTQDANSYLGEYRLLDIVSVETHNNEHTITYRHLDDDCIVLRKDVKKGELYRQETLTDKDLRFARLNRSQTVNLLWVSKIDYVGKKVIFITPDSSILSLSVYNFSTHTDYINTYAPFLSGISDNLHPYFFSV